MRSRWKFVHAADLHLDSPMRGLERYEGAPVEALRGATRRALENLVDLCLRESVALLVIAGDVYDGDWPDYHTGLFFAQQMARLTRGGVRVVLVRGNHDAQSRISRALRLPDGVHVLSAERAERVELPELPAVVVGRSYARRDERRDLAADYPPADDGGFHIGLLHTALSGRPGHEPYAPTHESVLRSKGYDYWALGHVHRREVVGERPWIVYPGNLQGRHVRESGPKGATLVTVADGAVESLVACELDVVRWDELELDASEGRAVLPLLDALRPTLEERAAAAGDRIEALRVRVAGASPEHEAWSLPPEALGAQVRVLASEVSEALWIEKVRLEPGAAHRQLAFASEPVGGWLHGLSRWREERETATAELRAELEGLWRRLPPELARSGEDPASDAAIERALSRAEVRLRARLAGLAAQEDA